MTCSKQYVTYIEGQGFQLIWFALMLESLLNVKNHISPEELIICTYVCLHPCRRCMSQPNAVREKLDNEHLFLLKIQLGSKRKQVKFTESKLSRTFKDKNIP